MFRRLNKSTWQFGRMLLVRRDGRVFIYAERCTVSFPEAEVKFHRGGILDFVGELIALVEKPVVPTLEPQEQTGPSRDVHLEAAAPVEPTETGTPEPVAHDRAAPAAGRSLWVVLRFALLLARRLLRL